MPKLYQHYQYDTTIDFCGTKLHFDYMLVSPWNGIYTERDLLTLKSHCNIS